MKPIEESEDGRMGAVSGSPNPNWVYPSRVIEIIQQYVKRKHYYNTSLILSDKRPTAMPKDPTLFVFNYYNHAYTLLFTRNHTYIGDNLNHYTQETSLQRLMDDIFGATPTTVINYNHVAKYNYCALGAAFIALHLIVCHRKGEFTDCTPPTDTRLDLEIKLVSI